MAKILESIIRHLSIPIVGLGIGVGVRFYDSEVQKYVQSAQPPLEVQMILPSQYEELEKAIVQQVNMTLDNRTVRMENGAYILSKLYSGGFDNEQHKDWRDERVKLYDALPTIKDPAIKEKITGELERLLKPTDDILLIKRGYTLTGRIDNDDFLITPENIKEAINFYKQNKEDLSPSGRARVAEEIATGIGYLKKEDRSTLVKYAKLAELPITLQNNNNNNNNN